MKLKLFLTIIMACIAFSMAIPSTADAGDYKYTLTEEDLPTGYEIVVSLETEYSVTQTLKTPTDILGGVYLSETDNNDTDIAKLAFAFFTILGEEMSISGADEGLNATIIYPSYYARKGQYIASITTTNNATSDECIKILEAQMSLHGGSAPGFTVYLSFLAIGAVTIVMKKRK